MKKNKWFSTKYVMVFALIAISLLQIYWLYANYEYKQEQFELNVKKALYGFRNDYKKIQIKKISKRLPFYELDLEQLLKSSQFPHHGQVKDLFLELKVLSDDVLLSYAEIYNLLKSHLEDVGVKQEFEFSLKSPQKIYYETKHFQVAQNEKLVIFQIPLYPEKRMREVPILYLYFPKIHNKFIFTTLSEAFLTIILLSVIIYIYFQTLNKYQKQKKITEVKNDFMNNMTHEFKTPLASISLACGMLKEPRIGEKLETRKKYIQLIETENNKLRNLVEKILQAAKWQKESLELEFIHFSLNQLIEEVSNPFYLIANEKNTTFEVIKLEEDINYYGDQFLIHQAIQNLLDNAFKYGLKEEHNHIVLKITKKDKFIEISVKDTGEGLTEEEQNHIFDQFYRVPKGNLHDVKGFGLGLYFVKKIMDAHKGFVKIFSEKEKGSEFILYLPLL